MGGGGTTRVTGGGGGLANFQMPGGRGGKGVVQVSLEDGTLIQRAGKKIRMVTGTGGEAEFTGPISWTTTADWRTMYKPDPVSISMPVAQLDASGSADGRRVWTPRFVEVDERGVHIYADESRSGGEHIAWAPGMATTAPEAHDGLLKTAFSGPSASSRDPFKMMSQGMASMMSPYEGTVDAEFAVSFTVPPLVDAASQAARLAQTAMTSGNVFALAGSMQGMANDPATKPRTLYFTAPDKQSQQRLWAVLQNNMDAFVLSVPGRAACLAMVGRLMGLTGVDLQEVDLEGAMDTLYGTVNAAGAPAPVVTAAPVPPPGWTGGSGGGGPAATAPPPSYTAPTAPPPAYAAPSAPPSEFE